MLAAITAFANGITATEVDPDLLTSRAIRLVDGTLASGGNRYEDAQIALWEFQSGSGLTAFDTSGVDPAIDLNFSGDVTWFGGWGISIGSDAAQGPGKAQASTIGKRETCTTSCRSRASSRSKHGSYRPTSRRKWHRSSAIRRDR